MLRNAAMANARNPRPAGGPRSPTLVINTLIAQNYIHERRGVDPTRSRHLVDTHSRDTRHKTLVAPCSAALCTCGTVQRLMNPTTQRHSMTRSYDVFAVTTVTVTDLTNKRTWIGRRFLFMPCRAQCCQIAPSFRNAACTHGRA